MYQRLFSTKIFVLLLVLLLPTGSGQGADSKTSTVGPKTKLSSDEANFVKEAAQGGLKIFSERTMSNRDTRRLGPKKKSTSAISPTDRRKYSKVLQSDWLCVQDCSQSKTKS